MDKLNLLLQEINHPHKELFRMGSLNKIVCSKDKSACRIYLSLENNISINDYLYLEDLLLKRFKDYKKIYIKIDAKNINKEFLLEAYYYYMNNIVLESSVKKVYQDLDISIEDNIITMEVSNKAEKMLFKQIEDDLLKYLNNLGYDISFNINIDKEKSSDIKEEIINSLKIVSPVKKVDKPVIMGEEIKTKITEIKDLIYEDNNIAVEAIIFADPEFKETRTGLTILTLKITDYTDSIYAKAFIRDKEDVQKYMSALKKGNWYKIRGYTKNDDYSKELVLNIRDINKLEKEIIKREDTYPEKRVELHTHTTMSAMDGICDGAKLVQTAYDFGHPGIAITDHNSVQSFPTVYKKTKDLKKKNPDHPFKVLYGVELSMIDDNVDIVLRPSKLPIKGTTYCVFDFETTGFNASGGDTIIEIGAVKIKDGQIIDTYNELVNPNRELPKKITELTGITDTMLKDKDNEENAIKRFIAWYEDLPLVAHNAKFDLSFLNMCYQKYNLGTLTNTVIDTLELSRALEPSYSRHSLSALVKRYNIPFDEESHHRADYDASATALCLHKMLEKAYNNNYEDISSLNNILDVEDLYKFGKEYHINLLALNREGLKNLFKLVSYANTKYLYKTPRIIRSEILKHREGLLIGSGCYNSEVFVLGRSKSDEEMKNIIDFYDYVEIQPMDCYKHLVESGEFNTKIELANHIHKIINLTKESGNIIVATSDSHYLEKDDKIYREIIINQKIPGGGRHPLARYKNSLPNNHFRTTNEMIEDFSFLEDEKLVHEIVITNPKKILDMASEYEVIIETNGKPFSPVIPNSAEITRQMVMDRAHELYGNDLPKIVAERIDSELNGIIGAKYDVIYLIAQKLVKKSNDDGYLVGSRGSVGSSLVATFMNITEVNPLPPHYRCPKCKHSIFEENNHMLSEQYGSGFDLPDLACSKCGEMMVKDGNDMPFATFLGFNGDKVPDIDLNFSDLNQADAHNYTKVLFGENNVFRAGTVGTVAEKTAFGFVRGYLEDNNLSMRTCEIERLAMGCVGVKRTTGQHPGGIVVIPDYMEVFDFTPFQYPADDDKKAWKTTHFDYHAIEENVLKLDILGHSDPTQLRILQDLSNMDITKIPLDDEDTLSLFKNLDILKVTADDILCSVGILGIPEFGTPTTIKLVEDAKPNNFAELIKISGLSHGTDVWSGNAQDLIHSKVATFKEIIGCRDEIMLYLISCGVKPLSAFKIMEFVRKGKASKDLDTWSKFKKEMEEANVPDWYIESCYKIKYLFPKAHATAYVISAFRIAYFKVHHPLWFYASWFSTKAVDFEIEAMIKGYDAIKRKYLEIINKGFDASNKEKAQAESLHIALEATARGIKIGNIDIEKSDALYFKVDLENNTLIPPFKTIDGLGDIVALKIVEERNKAPFLSIEDLKYRGKVSGTVLERMRSMHILDNMDESSQLSLF